MIKKPPHPKVPLINLRNPNVVGQLINEGVSGGGVSAISTIGGITGNALDQNGQENYSSNPFKYKNKDQGLFRMNSSGMSTANRNHLQVNTPHSALGYTNVLLGGANLTGLLPYQHNYNFYGNVNLVEEQEMRS
jgi:hypothetical protein